MRQWLWLGLVLCLLGVSTGQELESYLRLRKHYKITEATPVGALDLIVGQRVIEVEGIVRGLTASGDSQLVILEVAPNKSLSVRIDRSTQWIAQGQMRLRALLRVSRENEWTMPDYALLGAVYATTFERWQAQQQHQAVSNPPKPSQKPPARRKSLASRSTNTTPPRIQSWQTLEQQIESYVPYYYTAIRRYNPRLDHATAERIARAILRFSYQHGVDPRFIMAIVLVESGFNPNATSRKGAMGLGQLMPGTARGMGVVAPYDPEQNLAGTVRLVRGHLVKYWNQTGDPNGWDHVILALAAYNAGSGAVRRYGGVPPYKETQNYIRKVIRVYKQLCGIKK